MAITEQFDHPWLNDFTLSNSLSDIEKYGMIILESEKIDIYFKSRREYEVCNSVSIHYKDYQSWLKVVKNKTIQYSETNKEGLSYTVEQREFNYDMGGDEFFQLSLIESVLPLEFEHIEFAKSWLDYIWQNGGV